MGSVEQGLSKNSKWRRFTVEVSNTEEWGYIHKKKKSKTHNNRNDGKMIDLMDVDEITFSLQTTLVE